VGLVPSDWWNPRKWVSSSSKALSPVRCQVYTTSCQLHGAQAMSQTCSASWAHHFSMHVESGYLGHERMLEFFVPRHVSMDLRHARGNCSLLHLYTRAHILQLTSYACPRTLIEHSTSGARRTRSVNVLLVAGNLAYHESHCGSPSTKARSTASKRFKKSIRDDKSLKASLRCADCHRSNASISASLPSNHIAYAMP
jgi:hypothetical protein